MNGLVSNKEQNTIRIRFDSDISKVVILDIIGKVEFEKLPKRGSSFLLNCKQFSSGQYLVQFIKNETIVEGLKMAISI